jgi:hypothetical protein
MTTDDRSVTRGASIVALVAWLVSMGGWFVAEVSPPSWLIAAQLLTLAALIVWVWQEWR